jgi:hypothetical protein
VGPESHPPPAEKAAHTRATPSRKNAGHCGEQLRLLGPEPEEATSHEFGCPGDVDVAERLIVPPMHRRNHLLHEPPSSSHLELRKHLPSAECRRSPPIPPIPPRRDEEAECAAKSVRVQPDHFL